MLILCRIFLLRCVTLPLEERYEMFEQVLVVDLVETLFIQIADSYMKVNGMSQFELALNMTIIVALEGASDNF